MFWSQRLLATLGFLAAVSVGAPAAAFSVDFSAGPVFVTQVSPGMYTFMEGGFTDGATITGSFAGTDLNGDGQLSYFTAPPEPTLPLELTDFTLSFSGNTLVPAFALQFPQLDNFNYHLGPTLGTSTVLINGLTEGIEAGSLDRFYIAGPGPLALCDGTEVCGGVLAVPEPATWSLFLIGALGVGATLRLAPGRRARA